MAKVNEYGMTFKPRFQSLQVVDNTRYPVVKPLKVTENGEYAVPEDVDGFSPVKVAVPLKYDEGYSDGYNQGYDKGYPEGYEASQKTIILQEKTTEDNGEITADNGFTGLSKVIVNVPKRKEEQTKALDIAKNGTYDIIPDEDKVLSAVSVNINVPERKEEQEKTLEVTENGSYELFPEEGKALSKATVNVSIPQQIDALVKGTLTEYKSSDITEVGGYVFYGATALKTVEIPNVTQIGKYAFYQCSVKNFKLPENVSLIGVQAFRKSSIEITEIPASLMTLTQYVFAECKGIQELTFKGTPGIINESAFYGCDNLKTINVPWAEGEVAGAPWYATNATINYNYTEGAE